MESCHQIDLSLRIPSGFFADRSDMLGSLSIVENRPVKHSRLTRTAVSAIHSCQRTSKAAV